MSNANGPAQQSLLRLLGDKVRAKALGFFAIPYDRKPLYKGAATHTLRKTTRDKNGNELWWVVYAQYLELKDPRVRFPHHITFDDVKPFIPIEIRHELQKRKYRQYVWHAFKNPEDEKSLNNPSNPLPKNFRKILLSQSAAAVDARYAQLLTRMRILTVIGKVLSVICSTSSALATVGALVAAHVAGGPVLYFLASALVFSIFYIRGIEGLSTTPNTFINFFGGSYFCQGLIEYRNSENLVVRMPKRKIRQLKLAGISAVMASVGMGFLSYNSLLFAFVFFSLPALPYIIGPLVAAYVLIVFLSTLASCRRIIAQEDKMQNVRDYFKSLFNPAHPRNEGKKAWQVYLESSISTVLIPAFIVLMAFNIYGNAFSAQLAAADHLEKIPTISTAIAYWIAFGIFLLPSLIGRLTYSLSNATQLALDISRGTARRVEQFKKYTRYQRDNQPKNSAAQNEENQQRSFYSLAVDIFCSAMDAFSSSLFATQNNLEGVEKVMVVSGSGIKPLSIVAGCREEERFFRQNSVVNTPAQTPTVKAILSDTPTPLTPFYKTKQRVCWEVEDIKGKDPDKFAVAHKFLTRDKFVETHKKKPANVARKKLFC